MQTLDSVLLELYREGVTTPLLILAASDYTSVRKEKSCFESLPC